MKFLGISISTLILATGSAIAADLPAQKSPPVAAAPAPMWTGFYAGLNAGGTWSNSSNVQLSSAPVAASTTDVIPSNRAGSLDVATAAAASTSGAFSAGSSGGFIGGGQIGYNYQAGSFVGGVEADIQGVAGGNGNGSASRLAAVPKQDVYSITSALSARQSLDYLGTVRGRIGYLVTPTLLVYGHGGLAYGGVNLNVSGALTMTPTNPVVNYYGPGNLSTSTTLAGWTAGGGVEWMFMPGWSAKAEYLYYDLGSARTNNALTMAIHNIRGDLRWATATNATARFNGNIVRAGVNYHFNLGSAPVIAKF